MIRLLHRLRHVLHCQPVEVVTEYRLDAWQRRHLAEPATGVDF
jgi:hypothetical protein